MASEFESRGIEIRHARKEDMGAVASLIKELADYEKMPEGPKLSAKDLERDGFDSDPPLFRCAVAVSNDVVVGYALYFSIYSTWRGASAQLEDLYVTPKERGKGMGGKLFDYVAEEVSSGGAKRLDFHVLEWNPARKFYDARGATDLTEAEKWRLYRLEFA